MPKTDETKKINALLYKHNLEIALKNKTLSLLEKLYQKSILTLSPADMAQVITGIIREDLNLEFAGILLFNEETDSLIPLNFSTSERLLKTLTKVDFLLKNIEITNIKKRNFFKQAVYKEKNNITNDLKEVWEELIDEAQLEEIEKRSHIKTILLYPLMTGGNVLGALLFALNRDYETLNTFEKESIKSFINVIALSLDKAYLYKDLQDANISLKNLIKQRESLVHLVTHKVKGSFTRSKYIFAEVLEGTFGQISPKIKEIMQKGLDSDNEGINTVDLVLSASNLQGGKVKYDMKPIDFKKLAEEIIDGKTGQAKLKGLKLKTNIEDGNYTILGDIIWLKEAAQSLVDNALKYTLKGSVTVGLENKNGRVLFSVKDTGVGITEEDKKNLFTEGGRGKDSLRINVDSTGYGLYSARMVTEAHKGKIWVESEGKDKGSIFFLELPLTQK